MLKNKQAPQQVAPVPNQFYDPAAIIFPDPFTEEIEYSLRSREDISFASVPNLYSSAELVGGRYLESEMTTEEVKEVQTFEEELDANIISKFYENNLNKIKSSNDVASEQNKTYQVELEPQFAARFPGSQENKTVAIRKRRRADDKGTFGSVFSTQYCDQPVVLKIANGKKSTKKVQEEFQKEFGILKRLASSDHIMKGFGLVKIDDKVIGMMLEAMKGSLSSHLRSNHTLSEYARILLVLQCVIGLANMHNAGILHRDIKAENMLVSHDGNYACVGDVGTAVGSVLPQKNFIDDFLATTYIYAHLLLIKAAFAEGKPKQYEYNAQTELFAVLKGIIYRAIMFGRSPSIAHKVELPKKPETLQDELKPYLDNWEVAKNEDSAKVNKSGFQHLAAIYNKCEANIYPDMNSLAQDLSVALSSCPEPTSGLLPTMQSS